MSYSAHNVEEIIEKNGEEGEPPPLDDISSYNEAARVHYRDGAVTEHWKRITPGGINYRADVKEFVDYLGCKSLEIPERFMSYIEAIIIREVAKRVKRREFMEQLRRLTSSRN